MPEFRARHEHRRLPERWRGGFFAFGDPWLSGRLDKTGTSRGNAGQRMPRTMSSQMQIRR